MLTTYIFTHNSSIGWGKHNQEWKDDNMRSVIYVYTLVSPLLVMVIALFASFKSVQLFRDEINEGSLLLVISKPISRKKLLIYKWLSLITIFVIFILPILLTQTILVSIYIKYPPAQHLIILGALGELFVATIFFCLFSSIALIISLRLGVKSVIGLAFGATLLVVISNSIQTYTYKPQFTIINSSNTNENMHYSNGNPFTTQWNVANNDSTKTKVPLVYSKTSDKKPLFNKLWPLDLNYQISQMSNLFLHSNKYNTILTNGVNHIMKVKNAHHIELNNFSNSFFMKEDIRKKAELIINYFNTQLQGNTTITNYLALALVDAQTYLNATLQNYKAIDSRSHNPYEINITLKNFATYQKAKYAASAKLFTNIASNMTTLKYLWTISNVSNYNSGARNRPFLPINSDPTTISYDANTIFNILLNYQMSVKNARLMISKKVYLYDGGEFHIKSGSSKTGNDDSNTTYQPWSNVRVWITALLSTYNNLHDASYNNRIKLKNSDPLANFDQYFYRVTFKNYANPYILSFGYLGISIALIPLTYWWFSRSDFS